MREQNDRIAGGDKKASRQNTWLLRNDRPRGKPVAYAEP